MRNSIPLRDVHSAYRAITDLWATVIKPALIDGKRLVLEVRAETRSSAQNRLMWSVLADIARQVQWPVDGRMQLLDATDWKDVLSASLTRSQRVAQGVEGGFVMLGQRTSKMTVAEMADLVTLAHAFGSERNVIWSRTSLGRDAPDELCAPRAREIA